MSQISLKTEANHVLFITDAVAERTFYSQEVQPYYRNRPDKAEVCLNRLIKLAKNWDKPVISYAIFRVVDGKKDGDPIVRVVNQ